MSLQENAIDFIEGCAVRLDSLRYVKAIKASFVTLMPVIIVGAFSVLISGMVLEPKNGLTSYPALTFLIDLKPVMTSIYYATQGFLSIGAVFMVGIELARINGNQKLLPGLLAVVCFISVIQTSLPVTLDGHSIIISDVLAKEFSGSKSLFLGILIAIFSVEIYCKLESFSWLKIKMPDTVPSNIYDSFTALIPSVITVLIVASIGAVFHRLTGVYLYDAIYLLMQKPLESVTQSLWGVMLLVVFAQLFWLIGVHGDQMILAIRDPLLLGAVMENMDAYGQGKDAPNVITMPFWDVYMGIGGSGATIGLIIAVLMVTKRKDMREIARLSLGPAIFNINEPVIFGMPIILNPVLAIPFVITPVVTGTIAYFATLYGFAGKAVLMVPWTTPPLINAWVSTAGSMGAVMTQLVCIIISVFIYLPFVKATARKNNSVHLKFNSQ